MSRQMPTTRRTIELMEAAARAVLHVADVGAVPRDTCILHTQMAKLALAEYGVPVAPLAVQVQVLNPPAARAIEQGLEPTGVSGGRAVVIGFSQKPSTEDKWNGHLVLAVRQRFILDLSLDQCNKPEWEIEVPRLLALDARDFIKRPEAQGMFPLPNGGAVGYQKHLAADDDPFVNESWREGERNQKLRRQLAREVRRHLGTP